MNWKNSLGLILILFAISCSTNELKVPVLVDANWLQQNMENEQIIILDARDFKNYDEGHIPGALCIERKDIADKSHSIKGMRIGKQGLEKLLQKLGVKESSKLILYDDRGGCEATRIRWILQEYGYKNASILDGGILAWKAHDFPIEWNNTPETKISNFKFKAPAIKNHNADTSWIQLAIKDTNYLLLDVRSKEEYDGLVQKSSSTRKGHIPTAIHLNFIDNCDSANHYQFLPKSELKDLYIKKGITPDKKIIVYCQSGVRSSHTTFVLKELLNYPDVINYDGSWIEYSSFINLPVIDNSNYAQ